MLLLFIIKCGQQPQLLFLLCNVSFSLQLYPGASCNELPKEVLPERSYDSLSLCPLSPASQLSFLLLEGKFRHLSLVFVAMWASAPRGTHLLTAAIAAFPPRPQLKGGYCKPTTCSSLYILKKRVQVELQCSRCFHHLRFSTNNIVF